MFSLDHVALAVTDLSRSQAFYHSIGGVTDSRPAPHFVEIMLGGARLHLVRADRRADAPGAARIEHLCLSVPSLEELVAFKDHINSHPLLEGMGPWQVQESPPLDANRSGHVEQNVPRATLYFHDPDGIEIEVRFY